MKINDAHRLSKLEIDSTTWDKVRKHAEERLAALRAKTENPRETEADRLGAAWCISELKELLKLAQPAKEKPDAAD